MASVPDLPRDDVLTSEARHAIDEWDDVEPFPWLIQEGSVRLGGYPVPALGRATSRGVAGSCRRARPSRPSLLRNVLVDRMRRSAKLHVVVVLPSKAEEFAIGPAISLRQSRIVDAIRAAARSRTPREERLHVFGLSQWNAADNAYEGIYVHAKVGIIDDLWMTIGSTNCNSRSFEFDTELNTFTDDTKQIVAFRKELWSEHLQLPKTDPILKDAQRAIKHMAETAAANDKLKSGALRGRLMPMKFEQPPAWLHSYHEGIADEFF